MNAVKDTKIKIREINFQGLKIGGESDFSLSPLFALEINVFNFESSSHIVKDYYNSVCDDLTPENIIKVAQDTPCDILALKFNVDEDNLFENITKSKNILKRILPEIIKPLMI